MEKNTRTFVVHGASGNSYSICREQFDDHSVQERRFSVQSEQSYKFFQFFRKSGVVNSISEKKKVKIFFTTRPNSLIHSVENNLTIILV